MKRQPKPFWRKACNCYFVKINKKWIRLAADKEEAYREYHRIMADQIPPVTNDSPVAHLLGKFLSWCEAQIEIDDMKPLTFKWYKRFLTSFVEFIDESHSGLTVGNLKAHHVTEWRDKRYGKDSIACKRGAVVSVKRALNWAADDAELIFVNPVKKVKSGKPESRDIDFTEAKWEKILAAVDEDDPFRELLLIVSHTGCRPQEARLVECRHVDFTRAVWEFPAKEAKSGRKTGKKRFVPLNDAALEMTQRAYLRAGGEGRLFRNRKGRPLTTGWINSKCIRLSKKVGFRFFLYVLRHRWITNALIRGVDPCTVAEMAGNSPEMVMNVYNQIKKNTGHLRQALAQATGEAPKTGSREIVA